MCYKEVFLITRLLSMAQRVGDDQVDKLGNKQSLQEGMK
jgi:hypothetical protein